MTTSAREDPPRPATEVGGPRWGATMLLGFIVVALLALAFLPILLQSRIETRRSVIEDHAEPAVDATSDIQLSLAREMAALRGYLLSGEERFLDQYLAARAEAEERSPRLDSLVQPLGPEVEGRLDTLETAAGRWRSWVSERFVAPEYFDGLFLEQGMWEDAMEASLRLEGAIRASVDELQGEIASLNRIGTWVARGLVVLALGAVVGVALVGRRLHRLNETLDRWARREQALREEADRARRRAMHRARQEEQLREAAETVSAAYSPDEVLSRIAESAVSAMRLDAAFVERLEPDTGRHEVVAAAGSPAPATGTTITSPSRLTHRILERREPVTISPPGEDPELSGVLPDACADCLAVVVPLAGPEPHFWALFMIRDPEAEPFAAEELERARVFGQLASLALRKVELLETAESRHDELERLSESRSRLVRGFSHDLKNPLGAADAHASLLELEIKGPLNERQKESVRRIRATIRTAFDLINDLVEFGRMEAGELQIDREPVDVARVVNETGAEYQAQADAAGLELACRVDSELPPILTDPDRLRQILGNLLSNAVKYTEEGKVECVVRREKTGAKADEKGWVHVSVRDTGPGIPKEQQRLLFREFSRLDVAGERGVGLGLAISRRLARALGGDITLESEPGSGSTFILSLPLEPAGSRSDLSRSER